jgi:hypothetical protein
VICDGESKEIRADLTGIGPWVVDWSDGFRQTNTTAAGGPVTISRTVAPANLSLNQASNYTYQIIAVRDANCGARGSDITGGAVFTINPRPRAVVRVADSAVICDGESKEIRADLTGIGPWVVEWSDGFVQTNTTAAGGPAVAARTVAPANFSLNQSSNYTYTVTAVRDANCVAQAGDITGGAAFTIHPRPRSVVRAADGAVICNGESREIHADLTGIGPWIVTWSDGFVQTNLTAAGGPAVVARTVAPANLSPNQASNYVYSVVAVSDANCVAGPADRTGGAAFTINPRPTADLLSFTTTNSNIGKPYTLTNTLTGLGPWVITWNDGVIQTNSSAVAGPVILTRDIVPTNSDFNIPSNNTFFVTAVVNGNSCAAIPGTDIKGLVEVWVDPRPTALMEDLTTVVCNQGASFTLTNTLTGRGPWVVTWNDGIVQTNASTNFGPATLTRTVVPTNTVANLPTNNVFQVVKVSDATYTSANQSGDIEGIASFTVNPRPTATMSPILAQLICNGESTTVQANLTGQGPWEVTWASNGVVVAVQTNVRSSPAVFTVSPYNANTDLPSTTRYTVAQLKDPFCEASTADRTGFTDITVRPRVTSTVTGSTTIPNGGQAVLSAQLTGDGPWDVTWRVNGEVVAVHSGVLTSPDTLTVSPVNTNLAGPASFTYTVTDVRTLECIAATEDLQGEAVVVVNPRPTVASIEVLSNPICNGDTTTLRANLTGFGPWTVAWASNGVQIAIQTNVPSSITTLDVSPVNTLTNQEFKVVYSVIGLRDANAVSVPGDLTPTAEVTVRPRVTATMSTGLARLICNGETTTVQAALGGQGPWEVTWASNGVVVAVQSNVTNSPAVLEVSPYNPNSASPSVSRYTVAQLKDASCTAFTNDLKGFTDVTIRPRLMASVTGSTTIPNGGQAVISAALTGDGPWDVTWSLDGNIVAVHTGVMTSPDTLTVNPVNTNLAGPASFTFKVTRLETLDCVAATSDLTGEAVITVNSRPTVASIEVSPNPICNSDTTTLTANLTGFSPWSVTWASNGVQVAVQNNVTNPVTTLDVSPVNPLTDDQVKVVYSIIALQDANANAVAGDLTPQAEVVVNPRPTARVRPTDVPVVCSGSPVTVRADLTGFGMGPWQVTWATNGVPVMTNYNVMTSVDSLTVALVNPSTTQDLVVPYTITALSLSNCAARTSDLSGVAWVTVQPRITTQVTGPTMLCSGESNVVQAVLTGNGPWDVTWSSNGVDVVHSGVTANVDTLPITLVNTNLAEPLVLTYKVKAVSTLDCVAAEADLVSSVTVTVNARPAKPVSTGDQFACAGVTNMPLSVTVSDGSEVDWYTTPTGGVPVFTNTLTITPQTNAPGTHVFYAEARSAAGCPSAEREPVTLQLRDCTILTITPQGTNAVVAWFGPLELYSVSALTNNFADWVLLTNGVAGETNLYIVPDYTNDSRYFRLKPPQ